MTWSTKRDGYRPSYDTNNLGKPVDKLKPLESHTHVITVPGTTYKLFINIEKTDSRKLLIALAKTTVNNGGRKRVKANPRMFTISEFQASNTEGQAA